LGDELKKNLDHSARKEIFKKERKHLPWVTTPYKYQYKKVKKKRKLNKIMKSFFSFLALLA
jgi:predicted dithiol-disulfide oxidoreductase (DUF899 family)